MKLLCFRITNRVYIRGASKLLFILISDYKEGIIVFVYSFNLFKYLFIILMSCNDF